MEYSQIIRDSYNKSLFPNRFSTWLTGKAHSNKSSNTYFNWWTYSSLVITTYILSLATLIFSNSPVLLFISAMLLLAMSRRMTAVILHQAVHNRLSGVFIFDKLIGELCSMLTISQDFRSYTSDHCDSHHSPESFATTSDPILIFLHKSGIKNKQTKKDVLFWFLCCLVSPIFHIKFFFKRIRHNVSIKAPLRSLIFLTFFITLLWVIYNYSSNLGTVLLFVTLIFFYQISAFIEICSEHLWYGNNESSRNTPYFYADISWGRFCGLAYPTNRSSVPIWYLINLLYHFPVRSFILVGDLPQHDFHHRHPLVIKWLNAAELRNIALRDLRENEPEYIDIWGLHTALNHVFHQISDRHTVNEAKLKEVTR